MAVQSRTEAIDNLYTTTWQNMKADVADQIYSATPFYFWMKNKGNMDPIPGGRFIAEPLRYAKSDNVRWVQKGSTMPLSDKEFLTEAIWEWRYLADSIVRFGVDDQQNRGRNQIIDLALAKMQNSKDTLIDTMETTLFDAQTGNEMNGLQDLVADDPTASATVGGIDQSTNDWWRNQTFDFNATHSASTFVASGLAEMSNMLNKCSNNLRQDTPDLIVSGQVPYEDYEEIGLAFQQIVNKELLDAGFTHQVFKGIPMVWSPACRSTTAAAANNVMYFLNTRFLRLKYDPQMNFDMTEWKAIPDQIQDRAAQIIFAGNLTTNRRKVQGVIHNIDT